MSKQHDDDAKAADKGKAKDKSDPQDTGGTQDVAQDSLKHDQHVRAGQDHELKRAPMQGPQSTMGASGPEPKGDPAPRAKLSLFSGLRTQLDDLIERGAALHDKVDDAGLAASVENLVAAAHEMRTAIQQVFSARGANPEGEPQPEQQPEQPTDPAEQPQPV